MVLLALCPYIADAFEGTGELNVRSVPADAEVLIEGIYTGQTPLRIKNLRPGTYLVTVKYKDKSSDKLVVINPETINFVTFSFIKKYRLGCYVEDSLVYYHPSWYKKIPVDINPSPLVELIPIESGNRERLSLESLRRQYQLDGILHLKYESYERTSSRDVQINLKAAFYDYIQNRTLYEQRFVEGREYSFEPQPAQFNQLRHAAYDSFARDFSLFIKKNFAQTGDIESASPPAVETFARGEATPAATHEPKYSGPVTWKNPDYTGTAFGHLIGEKAPNFLLKDRLGYAIDSHQYLGQGVVLIYFFDASFDFCKKELDEINNLYITHKKQFTPIGICIAGEGNRRRLAENFLRARLYEFPVVFDTSSISYKYQTAEAVPMWVLIDREGRIRYIRRGTGSLDSIYQRIQYLNGEK